MGSGGVHIGTWSYRPYSVIWGSPNGPPNGVLKGVLKGVQEVQKGQMRVPKVTLGVWRGPYWDLVLQAI